MRGDDAGQVAAFSYISPEQRVPEDHPLRPLLAIVNDVLERMSPVFDELYSHTGRPSIPPERLLRALLLQVLYTVRSERMLMEQLDYNLLFRWFVGLNMDDPIWDPTVFTKNRDRLLAGEVAEIFFQEVLEEARRRGLLCDEHFTVDGTLIEAWASHKSFKSKDEGAGGNDEGGSNPTVDFRGQQRKNDTHASTTDPDARLYRKSNGAESKLCYMGHLMMDNLHGIATQACVTIATGTAEREVAVKMAGKIPGMKRKTLGADKNFDTKGCVQGLRDRNITPHVAQNNKNRRSAIDERTTRHDGYAASQRKRKLIEQIYGWAKTVGLMRKTRHRGVERVDWMFVFTAAAYNLVRIRNLAEAA
jgi:transposase